MAYWLMKSEPDVFSLADLKKKKVAPWDGVRNYQARNFLRAMRQGDQAFFYHSSTLPPAVVGVLTIVREAYPDPGQFDPKSDYYDPKATRDAPRWDQVDVEYKETFPRPVPLDELRGRPELQTMVLLRRSRLSVQPVSEREWRLIGNMARTPDPHVRIVAPAVRRPGR